MSSSEYLGHVLSLDASFFVPLEEVDKVAEYLGVEQVLRGKVRRRRPQEGVLLGHQICRGRFSRLSGVNVRLGKKIGAEMKNPNVFCFSSFSFETPYGPLGTPLV